MREVRFLESSQVREELGMLQSHSYMLDGYEEWKVDVTKHPFSMTESDYKSSRYHTHLLYENVPNFPFSFLYSSHTHKDEKVCRIVWTLLYSDVSGHKVDNLSLLNESTKKLVLSQIEEIHNTHNEAVFVYVVRSCVDYHDNPNGISLNDLDSYLTDFEKNYKKSHKGRLPDSVSFLSRLSKLVEKIF